MCSFLLSLLLILTLPSYNGCETRSIALKELSESASNQVDYHSLGEIKGEKIIVNNNVDLQGGVCNLPKDYTLVIERGLIQNGILVGDFNNIQSKGVAFDKIHFSGEWNVPSISTAMFADMSEVNALKNILTLTNPKVNNKVLIDKGKYYLSASYDWEACLRINSNTELVINGDIYLKPNSFKGYRIVLVNGDNIVIGGKGRLIGDRFDHQGGEGEWGMGININGSNKVLVNNITIQDCWGDCIYIDNNSKNVVINKCRILRGRRQGISIISANGVEIKNCTIREISGTSPECAIDVEPNEGDSVYNIIIENNIINKCVGGILTYGGAKNAAIKTVMVRNCKIKAIKKAAVEIRKSDDVTVENNVLICSKKYAKPLVLMDSKNILNSGNKERSR